jgi:hypothetical protein
MAQRPNVDAVHTAHWSQPAIVFVRPFDADTKAVDLATGRWGFGHVALFGCELDEFRQPLVVDAAIAYGVVRRRLVDMARGAGYTFFLLPKGVGLAAYTLAAERLGQPYHYGGLFGRAPGQDDRATCSGLVYDCLPPGIRAGIKFRRHPSPNDLARSLGVPRAG